MIGQVIRIGLGVVAAAYLGSQVRKPSKWVGRPFASMMNESHSQLTEWGLSHVSVGGQSTILDVGCGGGRTINTLAGKAAGGKIYGIDYAKGSVAASRAYNKELIAAGRVEIQEGTVSNLPFPADQFDLVTAIETQYYWPNLPGDMREIQRVLRPGGKLMIVAETCKGGRNDWLLGPVMWLLRSSHLSAQDQRDLFATAGFSEVQIIEEHKKGWICAIGTKPAEIG